MKSAREVLKEFEEKRLCSFYEFHENEIIEMMNAYAKEVFKLAKEKVPGSQHWNFVQAEKYFSFEKLLKDNEPVKVKRIVSDIDPYGEENWDEKENKSGCSVCGTELKSSDADMWDFCLDDSI
jgi:hypothetical protein